MYLAIICGYNLDTMWCGDHSYGIKAMNLFKTKEEALKYLEQEFKEFWDGYGLEEEFDSFQSFFLRTQKKKFENFMENLSMIFEKLKK